MPLSDDGKSKVIIATREPIWRFKECIEYYNHESVDVWSAYVSTRDVNGKFRYDDKKDGESVEMAVAVLTHKDAPFQVHMGVHRSPEHMLGENIPHGKISIDLHGFAAYILRQFIGQEKQFVITSPMRSMANIFKQHLDPTSYQEGSNFDGSFIKAPEGHRYDSNVNYRFELLSSDDSEKVIFKVESLDGVSQHSWFFKNTQPLDYFVIKVDSIAKLPGY